MSLNDVFSDLNFSSRPRRSGQSARGNRIHKAAFVLRVSTYHSSALCLTFAEMPRLQRIHSGTLFFLNRGFQCVAAATDAERFLKWVFFVQKCPPTQSNRSPLCVPSQFPHFSDSENSGILAHFETRLLYQMDGTENPRRLVHQMGALVFSGA